MQACLLGVTSEMKERQESWKKTKLTHSSSNHHNNNHHHQNTITPVPPPWHLSLLFPCHLTIVVSLQLLLLPVCFSIAFALLLFDFLGTN